MNTILKAIPTGLVIIEKPDGKVTYVNDAAEALIGDARRGFELLSCLSKLDLHALNGAALDPKDVPVIRTLLTGKAVQSEEISFGRSERSTYVRASAVPLYDENGEVTSAVGIFEDITERKKTEEAMKRFSDAANRSLDGIVLCDDEMRIIEVNGAALRIYEATCEKDLVGKHALSVLPPSEWEKAAKNLALLLETGHAIDEYSILTKKGNAIQIEYSGAVMKDEEGSISGFFNVLKDLTARKKTEQALMQESREWKRTFDSLPDLIAIIDNNYSVRKVNQAMAQRIGVAPEECVGLKCYKCIHGTNDPPDYCPHTKTLQDGKEHAAEFNEPHLGGCFLVNTAPLKDENGKMVGSVHVARNITDWNHLKEQLKLSQDRYRAAVEGCNDGIWDRDLKTEEVFFSDQWKRILGYEPEEVENKIEEFDKLIHPDDREETWLKIDAHIRGETPYYTTVFRMKHKDGSWRWIRSRGSAIRGKDGVACRIAGSHTDITERKRIEEELARYTRELEALVEERTKKLNEAERLAAVGQTAGMVGHDIRNPLQSIIGEIFLAEAELKTLPDSKEKANLKESCASIARSVDYINKIVLDLQDYARPLKPVAQETNLKDVIEETLEKGVIAQNISVSSKVSENVAVFNVDSTFLKRVLDNLVINAVQAMPNGGKLVITARKEKNKVVIKVEDDGVGIPEEIKPKLFTPLFTTKSKGQGFGLPVVKRLTEALNGTITVESQEGKGTKFTVKIPLASKTKHK
ncbi:MAG: PAS domain S-box protein [Candidatus Bathyarchaeota archaeon]|nr:PAS domain S-box protein [Candidatus Bathyarchaeota archaeon]